MQHLQTLKNKIRLLFFIMYHQYQCFSQIINILYALSFQQPFFLFFPVLHYNASQQIQQKQSEMQSRQIQQSQTENSIGMKPIYKKVQELLKIKQQHSELQRKSTFIKVIEPVPKVQLKINIDRCQQFIKKKQLLTAAEDTALRTSNFINLGKKSITDDSLRVKTKSEKMFHFLKANQSQSRVKRAETPVFVDNAEDEINRQTFTPMRPISRISRPAESVSGTEFTKRSGSQNRSSGGYSQVARLTQSSNKSVTPNKYLRKGHRIRETLLRQIETPEDIEQQKQLIYLKEYDQWVPASLATYKKLELQHFMAILTGGKKTEKKETISFEPYYL